MLKNGNKQKESQLGMKLCQARTLLHRKLIFSLIEKSDQNLCFKCSRPMTENNYSIEHRDEWLYADDPVKAYFNMDNIAFSHRKCNKGNRGRGSKSKTTKFKGIYINNARNRKNIWQAYVYCKGKRHFAGSYATDVEAAIAYDKLAVQLHGDKYLTNAKMKLLP